MSSAWATSSPPETHAFVNSPGPRVEGGDAGISAWVEQALADDPGSRPVADFQPGYGEAVDADRARLVAIRDQLSGITASSDLKLDLLVRLLEASPAAKVAVFATYGETVEYLDANLPERVRAKIRAAGIYGMEVEVIDGVESELRRFAERLAGGDVQLLADEDDGLSGAFLGELLRARLLRAQLEGELARIESLPWGIGAAFRQTPAGKSRGAPGVFFATRTRPLGEEERGYRYWRFVELPSGELADSDLEMLRRIDPEGGEPATPDGVDLEAAWQAAAASIVAEHNRRADLLDDLPPEISEDDLGVVCWIVVLPPG